MIPEEGHDGDDGLRNDVDGELVLVDRELLNELWETGGEVLPILVKGGTEASRGLCGIHPGWLSEGCGRRFS